MKLGLRWRGAVLVATLAWCCAGNCAAAEAQPSAIPYKRDAASGESSYSRVAIGLIISGLLAVGSIYVLRRRLGLQPLAQQAKQLRVIETQRLSTRLTLYVVEFAGQRYLISHSEHGVTSLASAPAQKDAPLERVE
ncbi:MAG: flagellar biosynthetic protein FliO [Burkholderiales bacterium]|nr:flagellar biosynthetic protein FliO [Burkholderiales bacterium]